MKPNIALLHLVAILLATIPPAQAQQGAKIPRVAYVTAAPLSAIKDRTDAFRQAIRELDYVDGKNIVLEWRGSDGNSGSVPAALIAEVVKLKVDVMFQGARVSPVLPS